MALALIAAHASAARAEDQRGLIQRVHTDQAGRHKYALFVPRDYTPEKEWPVILFLHGAGERGSDGWQQTEVGIGPYVKAHKESFPFLVVFPQAKIREKQRLLQTWDRDSPDGKRALAILEAVEKDYSVDARRRILTGWSMGGYGAWQLGAAQPERWSAVVPVSGGGDPQDAEKLEGVPVWAFHGAQDEVIPPQRSREMVAALRQAGGNPRYTEIPEAAHDLWKVVYNKAELYRWMRDPNPDGSDGPRPGNPESRPGPLAADEPFVPALEIPGAFSLRIGDDALRAASYSIPARVPRDVLSGELRDMTDSTAAEGITFRVDFSEIRYTADLARAYVTTTEKRRLRIQLGLEDVNLTIGRTDVTGEDRSAVAGPISIVIGRRRPAWLTIDVRPRVEKRRLRLELVGASFDIRPNNWSVSRPAGVSARGLGMTGERVSRGLVSGLYESRGRIEREVRNVVPEILAELEDRFKLARVQQVVEGLWPLPVYQPRVRIFPETVAVDSEGLTLGLGMTVAAPEPETAPETPRRAEPLAPSPEQLAKSRDLRVKANPGMLKPLTRLLIDAGVARVEVRDIPAESFARFADREALAQVFPDLARYGDDLEIFSELVLAEPITVTGAGEGAAEGDADASGPAERRERGQVRFVVPRVLISTSIRTDPEGRWKPYAELTYSVGQNLRAELQRPNFRTRLFELNWTGRPEIEVDGRFAETYRPQNPTIDAGKARALLLESWRGWTESRPVSRRGVPDIDFGRSMLRLSELRWRSPNLVLGFSAAGVKLTNKAGVPLRYETKGPYSGWGGPYTLAPGTSSTFDVPYAIQFRRRADGEYRRFTLPAGSHSEFRVPRAGGPPRLFQAEERPAEEKPEQRGD